MTIYQFKDVKHSVKMKLIGREASTGLLILENIEYKGLIYKAKADEVVAVNGISNSISMDEFWG